MKSFYLDKALSSPTGLPTLLAFTKPERIPFGTDNPYLSPYRLAAFTRALDDYDGFRPGQLQAIESDAVALFPRLRKPA